MSGKDQSVVSKEALMSTKPGKKIMKQALFKSKGYKLFNKYKEETENQFPKFAESFLSSIHAQSVHFIASRIGITLPPHFLHFVNKIPKFGSLIDA